MGIRGPIFMVSHARTNGAMRSTPCPRAHLGGLANLLAAIETGTIRMLTFQAKNCSYTLHFQSVTPIHPPSGYSFQ